MDQRGGSEIVIDEGWRCSKRPDGQSEKEESWTVHEVQSDDLAGDDIVRLMQPACIA